MIHRVKRAEERERRQHARFPQALDVRARSLPPVRSRYTAPREIHGRIQNLSEGGACILSSQPLPVATFVSCEIAAPDVPVPIPSLMQVCWNAKRGRDNPHFMTGLRFING
jgi:hypothetical protein